MINLRWYFAGAVVGMLFLDNVAAAVLLGLFLGKRFGRKAGQVEEYHRL